MKFFKARKIHRTSNTYTSKDNTKILQRLLGQKVQLENTVRWKTGFPKECV